MYTVTYRDSWNMLRCFNLEATSLEDATEQAVEWKGSAPISIVSVTEAR